MVKLSFKIDVRMLFEHEKSLHAMPKGKNSWEFDLLHSKFKEAWARALPSPTLRNIPSSRRWLQGSKLLTCSASCIEETLHSQHRRSSRPATCSFRNFHPSGRPKGTVFSQNVILGTGGRMDLI